MKNFLLRNCTVSVLDCEYEEYSVEYALLSAFLESSHGKITRNLPRDTGEHFYFAVTMAKIHEFAVEGIWVYAPSRVIDLKTFMVSMYNQKAQKEVNNEN